MGDQHRTTLEDTSPLDVTNSAPSGVRRKLTKDATNDTIVSNRRPSKLGSLDRVKTVLTEAAKPERRIGESPGVWQGLKAIIFASRESFRRTSNGDSHDVSLAGCNVLLILIPISVCSLCRGAIYEALMPTLRQWA
jgi:hypothetical protein